MSEDPDATTIAALRAFNRFHTKLVGALEEHLLETPYSLAQSRILYELATAPGSTPQALGQRLGLDAGYLSRLLADLTRLDLVARAPDPADARRTRLTLTGRGAAAFATLDTAATAAVAGLLAPLGAAARRDLMAALRRVEALLGAPSPAPLVLRPPRPGDLGWVVEREATLYAEEYGWDASFEGFVAAIVAEFASSPHATRERAWIAERGGERLGAVFLVRQDDAVAKLRLLHVEAHARGLGVGRALVAECIATARALGYRTLTLWTNDVLAAARRLYEAAGFTLVESTPHHSFGRDLVGENWSLSL